MAKSFRQQFSATLSDEEREEYAAQVLALFEERRRQGKFSQRAAGELAGLSQCVVSYALRGKATRRYIYMALVGALSSAA